MPIRYRRWFLDRLAREIKETNKQRNKQDDIFGDGDMPLSEMMKSMNTEGYPQSETRSPIPQRVMPAPKKFK
tara:strand:- start:1197 stop:1412 length:216 start_codon:yes stop_codon:yes gene_type:complete